MIKQFNLLFITFFNTGKIKYAPGTFASFFTCILFLMFVNFLDLFYLYVFFILILIYSFIAINNSFENFDSKDPKEIVIDEVVGQFIPLLSIPLYETLFPLPEEFYCLLAFVLFRIFDILKPYPINYIDENTKDSLGIMLDDIVAGIFSTIILLIFSFFFGG
jgi:phosphatidylglycerophosphatase A